MTKWFDIRFCPDGSEHVFGDEHLGVVDQGPMEGDWFFTKCIHCGVGFLRPTSGGDGLENVLAALEGVQEVGD